MESRKSIQDLKTDVELQKVLRISPYFVREDLASNLVDKFLTQGGFDNPNLEIPETAELPRAFETVRFDLDGRSYCIKREVKDPWHTISDCLHGENVIASTKGGVNHVAPLTMVEKNGNRYIVQTRVVGEPLRSLDRETQNKVIRKIEKKGIYCPDIAESVIIEKNGNWVFVDAGFVMSREEHDQLVSSYLIKEEHDTFFDEYKTRD